jgi:hypothetical protein
MIKNTKKVKRSSCWNKSFKKIKNTPVVIENYPLELENKTFHMF